MATRGRGVYRKVIAYAYKHEFIIANGPTRNDILTVRSLDFNFLVFLIDNSRYVFIFFHFFFLNVPRTQR